MKGELVLRLLGGFGVSASLLALVWGVCSDDVVTGDMTGEAQLAALSWFVLAVFSIAIGVAISGFSLMIRFRRGERGVLFFIELAVIALISALLIGSVSYSVLTATLSEHESTFLEEP